MVTIEQVELLESKVSKAIDYVKRITADNEQLKGNSARLVSENDMLYGKLDSYQKRIAELEVMLQGFKRDQERIEQGIISALERLNHFEDAVGDSIAAEDTVAGEGASSGTASEGGGMERREPVGAASFANRPSPAASVVLPPVTAQPASTGVPAASAFPGAVPAEPFAAEKEAAWADETRGESVAGSYDSSDLLASFEPEADASGAGASDETFGEMSGGIETGVNEDEEDDGFDEDDEDGEDGKDDEYGKDNDDEFLDALKNERPSGLGQAAAAFHENADPPPDSSFEKPASGLELDIF